jgi:hypothetical protein
MDALIAATVEETPAARQYLYGDTETLTWGELYELFLEAARMPGNAAANMAGLIHQRTGCASEE